MKKLKIILLFSILISIFININYKSIYKDNVTIKGTVFKITNNYIYLNSIENIIIKTKNKYEIGDIIKVKGSIEDPPSNKVFNLFSFKKYLLSKKIYKQITPTTIKKVSINKSVIYKLRRIINNRLNKLNNNYLNTFILGENSIDDKIYDTYKINGITHLFAISGMHIGIFSFILLFILDKIFLNKKISYILTSLFLLIYMFLINTLSVKRTVLLFIFLSINKIFKLNIKTIDILIVILYILLIINPYYIYDTGFLYSFIISLFLIKFNNLYINNNFLLKTIIISIISFLASFPITINNNFEINIISPILNTIFVPFISIIVFPFSLITFIMPKLLFIFNFLINILERISFILNNLKLILVFPKISILLIIIYYLILFLLLKKYKNYKIVIFILFIVFIYNIHLFNNNYKLTVFDVGQGDSMLLELKNKSILIDTGGTYNYSYSDNIIIPYLKSIGVRSINYLILSHGDYDHIGEAINLVKKYKIENVIFNCGEINNLENKLIEKLEEKHIKYYSCITELNINKNKLYFLQTKEYDNENDNSNVIYLNLNNYKFMFMGDAGIDKEKDILDRYELIDIDVLKVGHHGSKTSSGKEFINEINPKYSIISVGKNNKYGHPNKEVLENLENSKIYRTDKQGSIMFKIKNSRLQIKTSKP